MTESLNEVQQVNILTHLWIVKPEEINRMDV